MVDLKIDDELRDLLPPLSKDEKDRLEQNLLKDGYLGEPIYTWNGYIVDGHNRYEICKKHNIEFTVEDPFEGKGFEKVNIMEWMIHRQLGKRNLEPYQRLLAVEKYESKFREMAKSMQGNRNDLTSSPKGEKVVIKPIHTDKEIAKLAKVGSGTKARWDYVKNNDKTGEVKEKMVNGEIPITRAYDILQAEKKKEVKKQEEKDVAFNKTPENIKTDDYMQNDLSDKQKDVDIKKIITDVKSDKSSDTYWDFLSDVECIEDNLNQAIDSAFNILFGMENIEGKITIEEKEIILECLSVIKNRFTDLENKIKNVKLKGEK